MCVFWVPRGCARLLCASVLRATDARHCGGFCDLAAVCVCFARHCCAPLRWFLRSCCFSCVAATAQAPSYEGEPCRGCDLRRDADTLLAAAVVASTSDAEAAARCEVPAAIVDVATTVALYRTTVARHAGALAIVASARQAEDDCLTVCACGRMLAFVLKLRDGGVCSCACVGAVRGCGLSAQGTAAHRDGRNTWCRGDAARAQPRRWS